MAIKDIELKRYIKENDIDKDLRVASGWCWKQAKKERKMALHLNVSNKLGIDLETNISEKIAEIGNYKAFCSDLMEKITENNDEIMRVAKNLNSSYYKKTRLIKNKISKMFQLASYDLIFLTMTFTDDDLKRYNYETRREYISEFLNKNTDYYIANVDFGKEKEREHYHAIIVSKSKISRSSYQEYFKGNINFKYVKRHNNYFDETQSDKIAKYINKLTNHAIKDTTKDCRSIFPKSKNLDYLVASELLQIPDFLADRVKLIN